MCSFKNHLRVKGVYHLSMFAKFKSPHRINDSFIIIVNILKTVECVEQCVYM